MTGFKNEFSWSKSREEMFRKCARQYYYHYYGSWGGWQRDSEAKTRNIYVLKKLTNQHLWIGAKVHGAIGSLLQDLKNEKPLMPEDQVVERILEEMREDFKNSRSRNYWENPQACGLFEHEYQQELPSEAWKKIAGQVETCIRHFFQSTVFEEIQKPPKAHWLAIEQVSHFFLNEIKVYVAIDFALREDEKVIIYDWKSGSSVDKTDHDLQMACYGWYAWQQWNIDPKKIELVEVNLTDMKIIKHRVEGVNLEKIQKRIFNSIQDMQFLLEDIANNNASEERFGLTEQERYCNFCNFKKLCPKWLDAEGAQ